MQQKLMKNEATDLTKSEKGYIERFERRTGKGKMLYMWEDLSSDPGTHAMPAVIAHLCSPSMQIGGRDEKYWTLTNQLAQPQLAVSNTRPCLKV